MKFSILIAHYNNAEYFKDCYQSLLDQTYKNWEAIILDDASKFEEKEEVKKIIKDDARFLYFENDKNSGVGITKSKLIELATGDICCFVDPDDAIKSTALQASFEIFSKEKNTVLAYSKFISCDQHLNPISGFKSAMQVPNGDKYFFNYPVQIAHLVCFRKEIYEQTEKMNPEMKIAEDQDLYLKMYEKGNVKFIDEANYLYRTHSGGISQNENKKKSYRYYARAIWEAMKRRNITHINGKPVPDSYEKTDEIFALLEYQNKIPYRIKKKITVILQKLFG